MGLISILLFNDASYYINSKDTIDYVKQRSDNTIFLYYGFDKLNIFIENMISTNSVFNEINRIIKSNYDKDIFLMDLAIKPFDKDFLESFIKISRQENSILTGALLFNFVQNLHESLVIYSLGTNLFYRLGYFNINARISFGAAQVLLKTIDKIDVDAIDYFFMFIPSTVLNSLALFDETISYYIVKSLLIDAFCFENDLRGIKTVLIPYIKGKIGLAEIGYFYPQKLQNIFIHFWQNKFGFDITNPDYSVIREKYGSTNLCKKITEDLICEIKENSFVDALIVTMNNGERLKQTIIKLLESSYKNLKIYVFDNASTDNTSDILNDLAKQYDNIYLFTAPTNIGIPAALNWLFKNSNSPLVLRIDDDVDVEFNTIKELIAAIKLSPYAGISSPKIIRINPEGRCIHYAGVYGLSDNTSEDLHDDIYYTRIAGGPIVLYKREVINKVGPWNIQYSPSQVEDIEHCFRVYCNGYDIIYNGKIVAYHMDKGDEYTSVQKVNRSYLMMKLFKDTYGVLDKDFNNFV